MTEEILDCYFNLEIVDNIMEYIVHRALQAVGESIMSQHCLKISADNILQWLDEIIYANDYRHCTLDNMVEDIEVDSNALENYAPYRLKTTLVQR